MAAFGRIQSAKKDGFKEGLNSVVFSNNPWTHFEAINLGQKVTYLSTYIHTGVTEVNEQCLLLWKYHFSRVI